MIDLWKAAMDRGFRRAGDETYVGRLGEAPCTIALVPVIYGYLGVLVTAKMVSPLRGTLFWRRGRVASSMFSGGVAPEADDPTFAAEYRVLSDGPKWSLSEATCHFVRALHIEYLQAQPPALSILQMVEVPPDEATLARLDALIATLSRIRR
jgi:hypothetical protein